jgi:lipopolysaccharide export system protein LptC
MKARASTLFPLALAIALAGVTFWLERTVQMAVPAARDTERNDPDLIAERVTGTQLDQAGRPESSLTAAKVIHYPGDDSTELIEPRIVKLRADEPPLRVRSDRATVSKDGEEVRFYGNVVVTRDAAPERAELRLETSYLQVFPEEDIARTPDAVVITEGRSRLAGIGMEANARTRELILGAGVKGTFERVPGQ